MSFVSKNLQQTTNAMSFIKGATLFFLGMSAVLFLTQAFDIVPVATEVKGYFKTIILTSNGSNTAATGIELDGDLGKGHFVGDVDVDSSVNANTVNATTINGTTITGTTVKGTTISGATVKGTTVCVNGDCRTSRPSGGTVIGGDSVWSTGASSVAYYNLGNVGIGINIPTARLQVSGSVLFKDYLTFSTNAYIYPVIEQDHNGKSLNIYAGGVLDENGGPWVGGSLNLKGGDITDSQGSSGGSVYINGGAGTESGNIILGNIAGKVGIGITSPSELLHVNGNTKTTKLAVGTGIDGTYTTNVAGSVKVMNVGSTPIGDIYTNNGFYETYIGKYKDEDGSGVSSASNYGMIIHDLYAAGIGLRVVMQNPAGTAAQLMGRVGIGTTTPSAKLTVNGGVKAISLTMDPCSDTTNYPEGTMFYNNTANHYCFCDSDTVASDMQSPGTPCF